MQRHPPGVCCRRQLIPVEATGMDENHIPSAESSRIELFRSAAALGAALSCFPIGISSAGMTKAWRQAGTTHTRLPFEVDLELELHAEPHVERQPVQQWLQVIDIWRRTSSFPVLIRQPNVTVVGHIKEIRHEPEREALADLERIVGVQIESREEISPSQLAAAANRYFTGIQVDRVSEEFTDRYT